MDALPEGSGAIAARQWSQLQALLAEVTARNAFYRRKLGDLPRPIDSLTSFPELCPFTTKGELMADQAAHPPHGSNLTFPLERYTRFHQTSGTSGVPLRWLDTPESWDWLMGNWSTIFQAAGVSARDRVFFAFSFGPFIGFWLAFEAAAKLGCLCIPAGGLGSAARLRMLIESQATVLCCTPTYALRLAEVAAAEGIDLAASRISKIIVAGEPGGSVPAIRRQIESAWVGARVFDHHGMTEVGPVTYECPEHPGFLHVIETSYFAEIVNPSSGQPAAPGEKGELILTTLGRTGSPLLRYRTGDWVKARVRPPDKPCECGRFDLALEGGILDRVDDMVIVRGVNVFPSAVDEIVRSFPEITEYRVNVNRARSLPEIRVEIELTPDCAEADTLAARLEAAFQTALNLRVPVTITTPGTLPRFEMKAKRWVTTKDGNG